MLRLRDLLQQAYKEQKINHEQATYLDGYLQALYDYGIYNNGIQYIGALRYPIIEAFTKELNKEIAKNAKTTL